MAIAFVQSKSTKGVGVTTVAVTITVSSGSLLAIGASKDGNNQYPSGGCTDSKSQTYTRDTDDFNTGYCMAIYSTPNAASGSTTITVDPANSNRDQDVAVQEYSGIVTTSPADKSNHTSGSGTTCGTGTTAATTQADELVFASGTNIGNNNVPTVTGYNLREHIETVTNMPIFCADKIVSSTGTQTASFTGLTSGANCGGIVTYKAAAGGGGGSAATQLLTLLGVG